MSGWAASEAQESADASTNTTVLEEVTVTAQKRVERLQDIPISVAVLSGDTLTARGTQSLQDLTSTVPELNIVQAGPSNRLYVRGIGSGDNFSFDQSVGTFVDGIYHGRSRTSEAGFLDIDRIELLKGPQSVFFGNSAIGGAINMTTRAPSAAVSADLSSSYNFDWRQTIVQGAVGGPLAAGLSGRAAVLYSSGDGWLDDSGLGEKVPRTHDIAARGRLKWTPFEELEVNIKAEGGRYHQQGGILLQMIDCPPPVAFGAPRGVCPAALAAGIESRLDDHRDGTPGPHSNLNNQEFLLQADYTLPFATLSSVSGYLSHRLDFAFDPDGPVPADLLAVAAPEHYQQLSQELRLTSRPGGSIEYLAGLYFQHDRLVTDQMLTLGFLSPTVSGRPALAPLVPYLPVAEVFAYRQAESIYSAFGSVTYHVSSALRVVGGLRATAVKKAADKSLFFGTGHSFVADVTPFPDPVLALSQTLTRSLGPTVAASYARDDRHVSPSLNIQYELAPDLLGYLSYANGFKAGGFNGQDASPDQAAVPFGPEKVNAYEAGLKTQFFDRRMTFNLALFRSDYRDLQVGGSRPGISVVQTVQNAGGARAQGLEFEQQWLWAKGLKSSLSGAWLDSRYASYPNANATSLQALQAVAAQNLSGARTPYAPVFSATWNLDYEHSLGGALRAHIGPSFFYSSRYNTTTNNDPYLIQGGFGRLDLQAGISGTAGWDVSLLVRNVTDKTYIVYGAATPAGSLGTYSVQRYPPRSFTAQLRWHF